MLKTFETTKIIGREHIEFGNNIIIDDFTFIYAKHRMWIGNYVHIAGYASIIGVDFVDIQDFCACSWGSRILTATDDFKQWGFGNSTIDDHYRNVQSGPVSIGKFAIIGANAVVLPGVTIGEGVTVGACSVVTRDLEPWGVYIGNKRIKERDKAGVMKNYEKFCHNHPAY